MTFVETPSRFIRRPEVLARIGLSAVTVWRLTQRGDFPKSIRLSPGTVAWLETDIDRWINDRAVTRRPPADDR